MDNEPANLTFQGVPLTPPHLADFKQGNAVIVMQPSTVSQSSSYSIMLNAHFVPMETNPLSQNIEDQVEKLAGVTGKSREELIFAGLNLYELGIRAREDDKKFGVVEPDTYMLIEVVGV